MTTINLLPQRKEICLLIKRAFDPVFCQALIDQHQGDFQVAHTHYPKSYRNNERQVKDDAVLASQLFQHIRQHIPSSMECQEQSAQIERWEVIGLNPRLRICRYLSKQYFNKHLDGVHYESEEVQSKLTFMIYLNGKEQFKGGRTLFFNSRLDEKGIGTYEPEAGDLIIFDHRLWHSGEILDSGEKYILRSDIFYKRRSPKSLVDNTPFAKGHLGYIWTIAAFQNYWITGGRDKKIKVWTKTGTLQTELSGHRNSILRLLPLNATRFASASRDQSVLIWEKSKKGFRQLFNVEVHQATVLSLCKLDERAFFSAGADGFVHQISSDGELMQSFRAHEDWVWEIKLINEHTLITASEDGTIIIWNWKKKQKLAEWKGEQPITALAVDVENSMIWAGDYKGQILAFYWEEEEHSLVLTNKYLGHQGTIRSLKIDQQQVYSAGEDHRVNVWLKSTCSLVETFIHQDFVQDLLLDDGKILSVAYDGKIQWNVINRSGPRANEFERQLVEL